MGVYTEKIVEAEQSPLWRFISMSGADTGEGQAALVRPCGPLVVDMA